MLFLALLVTYGVKIDEERLKSLHPCQSFTHYGLNCKGWCTLSKLDVLKEFSCGDCDCSCSSYEFLSCQAYHTLDMFPIWSGETTFVNFRFCQSFISDSDVIVHDSVVVFCATMIVLNSNLHLFCDHNHLRHQLHISERNLDSNLSCYSACTYPGTPAQQNSERNTNVN